MDRRQTHYDPTRRVPYRTALLYKFIVACGINKDSGNPGRTFIPWTDNKKKVTCKNCLKSKVFKI